MVQDRAILTMADHWALAPFLMTLNDP